jgi:hypothetical protein
VILLRNEPTNRNEGHASAGDLLSERDQPLDKHPGRDIEGSSTSKIDRFA